MTDPRRSATAAIVVLLVLAIGGAAGATPENDLDPENLISDALRFSEEMQCRQLVATMRS